MANPGQPWSGRVTSLAVDPTTSSTVYAGTAGGGIWKSTNSGTSWAPTSDTAVTLAIGSLAIDPNNHTTIYAGTGEANYCQDCQPSAGVLKSTNGGTSWSIPTGQTGLPTGFYQIGRMVVDRGNSTHVYAATTEGLYLSTDSGVTWNLDAVSPITLKAGGTGSASAVQDIVQDANGSFWVTVADGCQLDQGSLASSANGTTWTERYVSSSPAFRISIGMGKDSTNKIVGYAGIADCATPGKLLGVAKNADADGAGSWSLLSPGPQDYFSTPPPTVYQGWYDNTIGVDPTNPNHALFGGITLLSTTNGGTSFTDVAQPYNTPPGPLHADFHAIASMGTLDHFYVGSDGGVWSTADLGNWSNLNQTLNTIQFYSGSALDLSHMNGGAQDNDTSGIPHAAGDPGASPWDPRLVGDGGWVAMDPTSGSNVIYADTPFLDIFKVDTGTGAQTEVAPCPGPNFNDPSCNDPTAFIAPFVMDTTNPARLYAGTNQVYRTASGGLPAGTTRNGGTGSWVSISGDLTTGTTWSAAGDFIHTMTIGEGASYGTLLTGSKYGKVFKITHADQAVPTVADITSGLPAFTDAASTGNPWITGLAVNRANDQEAWATVGQLGAKRVMHTTNAVDNTTTWSDITGNLPAGVVDSILVDVSNPQTIYVGMDQGAYVCTTCGGAAATGTWLQLGSGLPNVRVDAITLTRNDGGNLIAWTHGRGAWSLPRPIPAPVASLNPTSLTFSPQSLGTTSPSQSVTLTDTGNAPLAIASITTTGDFGQSNNCPSVLNMGASCTVNVTFTPSASGNRTGSLIFTDNASDNPQTVPLSGTGSTNVTLQSGPDVSSWGPGRLDIFALGPDGALWHKYYASSVGWQGWSSLGAPPGVSLISDPTAVSWGYLRIDVFVEGSDNALWHKYYDANYGGWSAWYSHGGHITSAPDAASWGSGRLDVFAKGTNNDLQHIFYSSYTGWTGWFSHGGSLSSGPGAVSWGSNRIDVFARGSGGDLQHIYYDVSLNGWSGWFSHGGTNLAGAPDASSWAAGRLDVFIQSTIGTMQHVFYDGSQGGWNPWGSIGGQLNADPGAVSWGTGRIDVFSRGTDYLLAHAYYANGSWSTWYSG